MKQAELRVEIQKLVKKYAEEKYKANRFQPGETVIPPTGKVLGVKELQYLVDASLDGWLTTGRFNDAFEQELAKFLGVKYVLTTNSGSSANLLALSALTSSNLKERQLVPGDEVITVAAGFPTTINPIIQNNLIPVFVDITIPTYNIDVKKLESAVSSKTKAIMLAHTLGNPFEIDRVMQIANKYNLWVVEDCCDALGATYDGHLVGTFGDISTLSFYPAHQITMGEGGAVFTRNSILKRNVESFRDWGRDCYCDPGKDNTCKKRFGWKLGNLPVGYDHKYIYSHVGYNLKITDMQAAVALAQLERLPSFVEKRRDNFNYLLNKLQHLVEYITLPEATKGSEPSWFGFPISLKDPFSKKRVELLEYLESHKIGSRLIFCGNAIKQPYFANRNYRVSGDLRNTDIVMNSTFYIGLYPGISSAMLDFVAKKLEQFFYNKV